MKCLVCNAETEERPHEGVVAHVCPEGCGLWMDPLALLEAIRTDPEASGRGNTFHEQSAIFEMLDHDVDIHDKERVCPMCGNVLNSGSYGADASTNVVIDVCTRHGVWLDSGELDTLEAWAARRFHKESEDTQAWEKRLAAREAGEDGEVLVQRLSIVDAFRSMFKR